MCEGAELIDVGYTVWPFGSFSSLFFSLVGSLAADEPRMGSVDGLCRRNFGNPDFRQYGSGQLARDAQGCG